MKSLQEYYRPQVTLTDTVRELSDPALSFERQRDQVNELVLNLLIKFAACYLGIGEKDIERIKAAAVAKTKEYDTDYAVQAFVVAHGAMKGIKYDVPDDDILAFNCFADLRATAAVFKEVAFNDGFDKKVDTFTSMDLGSGTGILMLASMIAARRNKMQKMHLVGCDISQVCVDSSVKVLRTLMREGRDFRVFKGDANDPELGGLFDGFPLSQWVSETISFTTPHMVIHGNELHVQDDRIAEVSRKLNTETDPFETILRNAVQARPEFIRDVREGRTAMFPDLVNGLYVPDNELSLLALRTAPLPFALRLDHAGREFGDYEVFGGDEMPQRWRFKDDKEITAEVMKDLVGIMRALDEQVEEEGGGS